MAVTHMACFHEDESLQIFLHEDCPTVYQCIICRTLRNVLSRTVGRRH